MPKKASTAVNPQRQLMIKVNACKRLVKEADYYEKEVRENEIKLQEMKEANKDPHDIKKFQEVLGESQMMIPVSVMSRKKALDELNEFVTTLKEEERENNDLMTCEWMMEANTLLGLTEKEQQHLGDVLKDNDGEGVTVTRVPDLEDGEAF